MDGISLFSGFNAQEATEIISSADIKPANEIHVLFSKSASKSDISNATDELEIEKIYPSEGKSDLAKFYAIDNGIQIDYFGKLHVRFAAEIFRNLQDGVMATAAKGACLSISSLTAIETDNSSFFTILREKKILIVVFAAEIFHNLHEDLTATASRGHALAFRVQRDRDSCY
ncbi:hypothetical protein OROHE_018073 [Orobanche hederae]